MSFSILSLPGKTYKCDLCDKQYTRGDQLKVHKKKVHENNDYQDKRKVVENVDGAQE